MHGMTKAQSTILSFIKNYIATNNYSPSYMEIKAHCGFASLNAVAKHLAALKRKGFLNANSKGHRALNIVQQPEHTAELLLPLVGKIADRQAVTFFNTQHQISVPKWLVRQPEKTYLLKVEGYSLHDELIGDGDFLIVEASSLPQPGDTIIALINELDSFVMQYFPEGSFIKLVSRNVHYQPMVFKAERVEIKGILLGLFRPFQAI